MAVLQGGGLPSPCVCYPKDPMWNRVTLKSASPLEAERSEIVNSGSTQHVKTLFKESFSLAACNRCYTASCQFSIGIRA